MLVLILTFSPHGGKIPFTLIFSEGQAKPGGKGCLELPCPQQGGPAGLGSWAAPRAPTVAATKLTGNFFPVQRDKACGQRNISPAQQCLQTAITGVHPATHLRCRYLPGPQPPCRARPSPGSGHRSLLPELGRGRADVPTSHARCPPRSHTTRATSPAPPCSRGPAAGRPTAPPATSPVSQNGSWHSHARRRPEFLSRRFPVSIPFRNAARQCGLWIPPGEPTVRTATPLPAWHGNAFGTRAATQQSPPGLGSTLCFPPTPRQEIESRFPKAPPAWQTPANTGTPPPGQDGPSCLQQVSRQDKPQVLRDGFRHRSSRPETRSQLNFAHHEMAREVCSGKDGKQGLGQGGEERGPGWSAARGVKGSGVYQTQYPHTPPSPPPPPKNIKGVKQKLCGR